MLMYLFGFVWMDGEAIILFIFFNCLLMSARVSSLSETCQTIFIHVFITVINLGHLIINSMVFIS